MDPGYSIQELIKAAVVLKRIYDSFFSEYDNAPRRIRQLVGLVKEFHDQLCDLGKILELSGRQYPGQDNFNETLEECQSFIEEYRATLERRSFKKVAQTALFTFDHDKVDWLLNRISIHVQGIGLFTANLLLRKALGNDDTATVGTAPSGDLAQELTDLYNKATLYQYKRKRLDGQALQLSQSAHSSSAALEDDFQNFLTEVRRRLVGRGVVETQLELIHQIPAATALPNDFLLSYTEQGLVRHEGVVSGSPSRRDRLSTPAVIKLGSRRIEVLDIVIKDHGRKITSRNRSHTITVIHRLSSDQSRYPYSTPTTPTSEVYFLGDQSVQVYKDGRQVIEATIETCHFEHSKTPVYHMKQEGADIQFQEYIREKTLQNVLVLDTLTTGRRKANNVPEVSYEHIKLWKDQSSPEVTASFFMPDAGTLGSGKHLEFSADWLKPLNKGKECCVKVEFVSEHETEPPKARRSSSWTSKLPGRRRSSQSTTALEGTQPNRQRLSTTSTATNSDQSTSSTGTTPAQTSRDFFAKEFKWFKIEFENKQDQHTFTETLKKSQDDLRESRLSKRHPVSSFESFSFNVEAYNVEETEEYKIRDVGT